MPDPKKILPPTLLYYLKIISVPATGLCVLLSLKMLARGYIDPFGDRPWDGNAFILPPALYFLSLPVTFAFWIYALRDTHRFTLSFSPSACLLSMVGFLLAASLDIKTYHVAVVIAAMIGCVAGVFIFVNWREFCRYAFRDERMTCVALIGITASACYSLMDKYMWQKMAFSAAQSSGVMLQILGIDADTRVQRERNNEMSTVLSSDWFTILVYQPCSGLEGIFLFTFLLSIVILLDWKLLKKIHLIETYLIGFIYMYLANVLRITSLFVLGYFSHAPDASPLLASMQGLPLHIFHSFIGQIYYILAFMLFSYLLYAYTAPARMEQQRG